MNNHLSQIEWYGQPAWQLESDAFRVVTVPRLGAKIVSLFDSTSGREWLVAPKDGRLQPVAYGAVFIDQDMSGWDEMFPTINECDYPLPGVYQGARLPDHGEVWALEWDVVQADLGALRLEVQGVALPYRLARTLSFADARSLRLQYELTNTGETPLLGLWAAHPQFKVGLATEIHLPADAREVVNVYSTAEMGETGHRHSWPLTQSPQGEAVALDCLGSLPDGDARKYYLPPEQSVSRVMLRDQASESGLQLSWQAEQIPYLGIWMDNRKVNVVPTIALEPSTGYYDSLTLAYDGARVPVLQPGAKAYWEVTVSI